MNFIKKLLIILMTLTGLLSYPVWATEETQNTNLHEGFEKGGRGGRVFKKDNITLELLLFEKGIPPHFRAYIYQDGALISPGLAQLTVTLIRFDQKKESITFGAIGSMLQSNQVIKEPHSFDVSIELKHSGTIYNWQYQTYEGRVKLEPAMLEAADIQIEKAEGKTLKTSLKVVGKILANRDTMAPIYARYSGVIKIMNKNLGDEVNKGELLATVESNESLQNYDITAPITGTIVQKYATNGELAQNNKPIYDIANLKTVWADFTLYRKEVLLVKKGMQIHVVGDEGNPKITSSITYIAPLGIEDSQTTMARAILANEQGLWIPGMYVNGYIIVNERAVPVAVSLTALQRINDQDVVFVHRGGEFEAAHVTLGQRDEHWAEVVSGLDAGEPYVSKNSFYLKAELGKEGASHDD